MSGPKRAAVLLAAGLSSRMGQPKALLPWNGEPLVAFQVRQLRAAGADPIVVVVGAEAERVGAAVPPLPAVRVVANPDFERGRSTSIRAGAAALPEGVGVLLVQSVDQPCVAAVQARLYEVAERSGAPVVVPTYQGRRGHPIALAGWVVPELADLSEERQGLREVVQRYRDRTVEVPVEWEGVLWNLNRPEDYEAARRAFHAWRHR